MPPTDPWGLEGKILRCILEHRVFVFPEEPEGFRDSSLSDELDEKEWTVVRGAIRNLLTKGFIERNWLADQHTPDWCFSLFEGGETFCSVLLD
ncbi:hypothetical protein AKJ61_03845, partial [candidate division MSBL1 archaeon SCGC-AAA259B11]